MFHSVLCYIIINLTALRYAKANVNITNFFSNKYKRILIVTINFIIAK